MEISKISNKRQAEFNRFDYSRWKHLALERFGYFPIFQPFKESFLLANLSGNAVKLYVYLGLMTGNETGETWVSISTISKYFNKSEKTIWNWLKELQEAKLIKRFQLEKNGVAHTFLLPYGENQWDNPNSLQKK